MLKPENCHCWLVLVLVMKLGVRGAVLSFGGSILLGTAVAATIFFNSASGPVHFAGKMVGAAFGYGIRAHVANLAWFLHYRADMFLIGYIAGPAALGFYTTAANATRAIVIVMIAVIADATTTTDATATMRTERLLPRSRVQSTGNHAKTRPRFCRGSTR